MIAKDTLIFVFKTLFVTALFCVLSLALVVWLDLRIATSRATSILRQASLTMSAQNYLTSDEIDKYNTMLNSVVERSSTLYACSISKTCEGASAFSDTKADMLPTDRLQGGTIATVEMTLTTVSSLFPVLSWDNGFVVNKIHADGTVTEAEYLTADDLYNSANKQIGNTYTISKTVYCSRNLKV